MIGFAFSASKHSSKVITHLSTFLIIASLLLPFPPFLATTFIARVLVVVFTVVLHADFRNSKLFARINFSAASISANASTPSWLPYTFPGFLP